MGSLGFSSERRGDKELPSWESWAGCRATCVQAERPCRPTNEPLPSKDYGVALFRVLAPWWALPLKQEERPLRNQRALLLPVGSSSVPGHPVSETASHEIAAVGKMAVLALTPQKL